MSETGPVNSRRPFQQTPRDAALYASTPPSGSHVFIMGSSLSSFSSAASSSSASASATSDTRSFEPSTHFAALPTSDIWQFGEMESQVREEKETEEDRAGGDVFLSDGEEHDEGGGVRRAASNKKSVRFTGLPSSDPEQTSGSSSRNRMRNRSRGGAFSSLDWLPNSEQLKRIQTQGATDLAKEIAQRLSGWSTSTLVVTAALAFFLGVYAGTYVLPSLLGRVNKK
jgi:hypothetical protein